MATIKEYWRQWLWRDALTRIITINCLVWLVVSVVWFFSGQHASLITWLALPRSIGALASCPWTVVTYMFTQADFLHMMVNMLWLLLFGRLYMQMQGEVRLVSLYILGGLCGAVAFMALEVAGVPAASMMFGASCAVLAVVGAVAVLYPSWHVRLLILGDVKLVWLAVAAVVFFVVLTTGIDQSVAHGAGLLCGLVCGLSRRQGVDLLRPFTVGWQTLTRSRVSKARTPQAAPRRNGLTEAEHAELDRLLSKVGRSGYASLGTAERQRLFDLSQRSKTQSR